MLVSVIIPTYNRYTLLQRAIRSLLEQTHQVAEVIVVDDGSTDNTAQIQKDFPYIRYIYQENSGVAAARNRGIELAQHKWIAFLDSDDEWHSEKLERQVLLHRNNPDILFSYTAELWLRNNTQVKIPKKYKKIGQNIFVENLSYCNIAPSSVLLHRSILERVGFFDDSFRVCEDYELWLRILSVYEAGLINEPLIHKHAGHDLQLGFSKNMETLRIRALEKLLHKPLSKTYRALVQKELEEKLARQK
ncbi:MAG: glycosyltransferase family 2 protein [Campylobacterales bacterium]|nr:glycosyltransferase family 2 protein [Campylobacterales bacterium]